MKTVNLELSKKLKEAGYPQNQGKFHWWKSSYSGDYYDEPKSLEEVKARASLPDYDAPGMNDSYDPISSPTADEILEQINNWNNAMTFKFMKTGSDWFLDSGIESGIPHAKANSLADCAAKLWLYLKQQGLLKEER